MHKFWNVALVAIKTCITVIHYMSSIGIDVAYGISFCMFDHLFIIDMQCLYVEIQFIQCLKHLTVLDCLCNTDRVAVAVLSVWQIMNGLALLPPASVSTSKSFSVVRGLRAAVEELCRPSHLQHQYRTALVADDLPQIANCGRIICLTTLKRLIGLFS